MASWAASSRPSADGLQYDCGKARLGCSALPHVLPANWQKIRKPTSGLEPLSCSLRVIIQALQGCAQACNSPIPKRLSLLGVAACCTALRSRWCQSGVRTSDSFSLTAGPMTRIPDPSEPQSANACFSMLPYVAELAYLRRFPCWRLPTVSARCALRGVSSGVIQHHCV
jgi:hypothetical protein